MTQQPLALQWLCFIRDYGTDLKVSKEARVLAGVLPTYGEGKKIFVSMVSLSKVTGMKRETVRNARRELQDKGLLEDITGDPEKQERTYCLVVPDYVTPERTPKVVLERTTPGPEEDHNMVLERTTPGPQEDHNIKLLDQEVDQPSHHQGPGDDESLESPSGQGGPSAPGQGWTISPADKEWVAKKIGVQVSDIDPPLWRLIERRIVDATSDKVDGHDALGDVIEWVSDQRGLRGANNPVGYLYGLLARDESFARLLEETQEANANRQDLQENQAAEQQKRRDDVLAALPNYIPQRVRPLGDHDPFMLRDWRGEKTLAVWYHRATDMIFSGNHENNPGPGWEALFLKLSAWKTIANRDVICLRDDEAA